MRSWKYTFRPYSLFVFSLQLFMFPVLPSSYCLPIFFCPCFLKASFDLILAFLWVARVNKRSSSLGPALSSHPCHISVLLWPQKHLPSLPVRPILTRTSFCYQFSLSWSFREMSWLCHDSHLVGCRSGPRCALPSSVSQVRPSPLVPYSGTAVSLCLGQVAFSSAVITLLSCLFSPPFHSQHLVFPILWNDPWATLLILVEVLPF